MVLEASGPLCDVVEGLDREILLALAEGPRGVVCDLSGVPEDAGWIAVEVLATAYVARTQREWRLDPVVPLAGLVASELVASSSVNAGTDIDLAVSWHRGALRLSVRDHGPALPGQRQVVRLQGQGLKAVLGLSHAFGVMPATDGGTVVWAVLVAPRPHRQTWPRSGWYGQS